MQALRVKLGNPTFFRIMRGWYQAHKFGNGRVEQFTDHAGQVSGVDLDHFFDVWL